MLRPSRPMIRPFISSLGQLDQPRRRLAGVGAGEPPHRDREDVARPAIGLAPALLLDLDQRAAGLVAGVVLDVGDQQLLGLRGGQAREPLELLALDALLPLQLLGLPLEVALAILQRLLAPLERRRASAAPARRRAGRAPAAARSPRGGPAELVAGSLGRRSPCGGSASGTRSTCGRSSGRSARRAGARVLVASRRNLLLAIVHLSTASSLAIVAAPRSAWPELRAAAGVRSVIRARPVMPPRRRGWARLLAREPPRGPRRGGWKRSGSKC